MIAEVEKKQPASEQVEVTNHQAEICVRAYELYVDRGMDDGHDLEDWLRAEKEVLAETSSKAAA
jgi:hypothetical protein